ncbi:uncharacterized protein [Phyllobates terribilis]|uniref:uncharacterized protein n=1 Tax=Phyllobates terribilis TaxID=111132 RepID=UPI003CCAFD24
MECENSFSYGVCNTSLSAWTNDLQSGGTAQKRKRYENGYPHDLNGCKEDGRAIRSRATCFVQMLPNKGIFQSEKWKPNGSTLYYPITSHLLVNLEKYDQISFDEGLFFIGDDSGGCLQKEQAPQRERGYALPGQQTYRIEGLRLSTTSVVFLSLRGNLVKKAAEERREDYSQTWAGRFPTWHSLSCGQRQGPGSAEVGPRGPIPSNGHEQQPHHYLMVDWQPRILVAQVQDAIQEIAP